MKFPPLNFNTSKWDDDTGPFPEIDYVKLRKEFESAKELQPGSEQAKYKAIFENGGPGVFYLKNPPIAEKFVQKLVNSIRAVLNSPEDKLNSYHVDAGGYTGYSPFAHESTEDAVNMGRGIVQSKPGEKDQCIKFSWELNDPQNKWPDKELESLSIGFTQLVLDNTKQLLRWIVDLYLPEEDQLEVLYSIIESAQPVTRHLLYPGVDQANSNKTKMHPHADISLMTTSVRLPAQNGFNALHYEMNGKFTPAPTLRNTLSMHVGEPFTAFYQGKKKMNSPVHYVAMPPENLLGPEGEHTTLVTFVNPGDKAKIPFHQNSYYRKYHDENKDGTYETTVNNMVSNFIPNQSKL